MNRRTALEGLGAAVVGLTVSVVAYLVTGPHGGASAAKPAAAVSAARSSESSLSTVPFGAASPAAPTPPIEALPVPTPTAESVSAAAPAPAGKAKRLRGKALIAAPRKDPKEGAPAEPTLEQKNRLASLERLCDA